MAKSPASVSLRELPSIIDKAVGSHAAAPHLEKGLVIDWTILGRILREELARDITLQQAGQIAGDITKTITKEMPGAGQLEPAVMMSHGRIICGFLPPRDLGLRLEA